VQIREILNFAKHWLPIALVLAILTGAAGYLYTKQFVAKEYESTVTLEVQSGIGLAGAGTALDPNSAQQLAQTEAAVAEQYTTVNPAYALVRQQHPGDFALGQRATSITCSPALLTTLFSCTVTARNPQLAADMANAMATVFIQLEHAFESSRYHTLLARILAQEKTALAQHNSGQYLALAQTESQIRLSAAAQQNTIRITAPAVVSLSPARPNPTLNALIGFFVMLFLALGVGTGIYALNDSLRSDDELKELTGLPILGSVPYIASLRGKGRSSAALVSLNEPRSRYAEAFRVLRTNLAFMAVESPIHTLLVTSALEGEGKSTIAANLAIAFAESGKRTIIVDLDLHRPSVRGMFDAPPQGVTGLLLNAQAGVEQYLAPTAHPNLRVLPTGPIPANPSALIGSPRMKEIFDELVAMSDVVVVDSPPLLALTDAAIASTLCDGTVIVSRPDRLNRRTVKRLTEVVLAAGMSVRGTVINSVTPKADGYYTYYTYSYYNHDSDQKGGPSKNGRAAERTKREEARR